ncbi:MAG: class I SAM-dependent methyltransferase [Caldimonas sp.]
MKSVRLRPGKERSLLRRHPWVFEGSVAGGRADSGETVRVEDSAGGFLAWAAYSPQSAIRLRAWSFDERERIDAAFFARRIGAALAMRAGLAVASDGVRLVHGEADGLPGLVVDRSGDVLSAQFRSAGAERWKGVLVDALLAASGAQRLYERSDTSARAREGLVVATGWLRPAIKDGGDIEIEVEGEGEGTALTIREHDWRFAVDVASGHKTGFYLDQRDNRKLFADTVRHFGFERVLNCYCYTGGFSVAALAGGAAHVTAIDSSAPALALAEGNVAMNGFAASAHRTLDADVNQTLRALREAGESFDAIVLDPPKLAPTVAHAERAARAYKDINRLALLLLRPGGALFTFSCSGGIDPELFHKIVAGAGIDAGVDGYIQARLAAAPDHPMTIDFPEGGYLKGLVILKR